MYLDHARAMLPSPGPLRGARIGLDCANGATATVAPRLFRALGFEVVAIGVEPDGRNINLECGSTHPECLSEVVKKEKLRFGVAFDGDGDRAILIDADGRVVDGDAVLYLCARHMRAGGRLKGDAIVATVMSNIGLEIALREAGIGMLRCPVGDKYVMEELVRRDLALGGEQSGHVIFSEHLFTGDGIVTALAVVRAMVDSGRELSSLAGELVTYPQVLVNVRVKERRALDSVPAVKAVTDAIETRLTGAGRLLDPLLRHGAAAAHHDRGQGPARDPGMGRRDRVRGADPSRLKHTRRCRHDPSQRQRQQGRHAAQLAGRTRAERARRRAHDRRGGGVRACRSPRSSVARHRWLGECDRLSATRSNCPLHPDTCRSRERDPPAAPAAGSHPGSNGEAARYGRGSARARRAAHGAAGRHPSRQLPSSPASNARRSRCSSSRTSSSTCSRSTAAASRLA